MISDALACQMMANKYRRLARQHTDTRQQNKYRAYASAYYQKALRFAATCKTGLLRSKNP